MPVQMEDFSEIKGTMEHLNKWANAKNKKARVALLIDTKDAEGGGMIWKCKKTLTMTRAKIILIWSNRAFVVTSDSKSLN